MRVIVTGTDTGVGKTLVSSWLCLHSGYDYFKPFQTGYESDDDTRTVQRLSPTTRCHPEIYRLKAPLSPHQAAALEGVTLHTQNLVLPQASPLLVEGVGGLMVPLNDTCLFIDLIKQWQLPVILVARTTLGTLNHTLLSLEALRTRAIPVWGVVLSGPSHPENAQSLEIYGNVPILGWIPPLENVTTDHLKSIPLPPALHTLMKGKSA